MVDLRRASAITTPWRTCRHASAITMDIGAMTHPTRPTHTTPRVHKVLLAARLLIPAYGP